MHMAKNLNNIILMNHLKNDTHTNFPIDNVAGSIVEIFDRVNIDE